MLYCHCLYIIVIFYGMVQVMNISEEKKETPEQEKLQGNFDKIARYLEDEEVTIFNKFLIKTLNYGLKYDVENIHIFDYGDFHEFIIGNKNSIIIPEDVCEKVKINQKDSLSFTHNHPNNTAPSIDDYNFYFKYPSIKDMVVCGHIGNLFFMKKSILFINSDESTWVGFSLTINELSINAIIGFNEEYGYTIEKIIADENIKNKCTRYVSEIIFDYVCNEILKHDKDFKCYKEGLS